MSAPGQAAGAQPPVAVEATPKEGVEGDALGLMRPHVGSQVRVRATEDGTAPNGCLKLLETGEIMEDDRSPIPYKVQAPNGESSWYKLEQLEHLATYSVEDVLDQQRLLQVLSGQRLSVASVASAGLSIDGHEELTAPDDGAFDPFDVTSMRFSWQESRGREMGTELLHPRRLCSQLLRRAQHRWFPWLDDRRNQQTLWCILLMLALLGFVATFTAVHAEGYRMLRYSLERDEFQTIDFRYDSRNDGCQATQQLLGVVRPDTFVDWPPVPTALPPSPPPVNAGSGGIMHRVCVIEADLEHCYCQVNWMGEFCDIPVDPGSPLYQEPEPDPEQPGPEPGPEPWPGPGPEPVWHGPEPVPEPVWPPPKPPSPSPEPKVTPEPAPDPLSCEEKGTC